MTPRMCHAILIIVIDELDQRLIRELALNSRQASAELSRKLGVSDTTVRRRIERLQERKIITCTVVPDAAQLGYTVIAIIALQVDLGSIDEVAQSLVDCPNVHYVADCTGSHDMFIGAWFHSSRELRDFVKDRLAKMPGIRKSETFVMLDVKKNEVGWLQRLGQIS